MNPVFTGEKWQSLGYFWISGTQLTVKPTGVSGGKRVVADAVRIIEVSPTTSPRCRRESSGRDRSHETRHYLRLRQAGTQNRRKSSPIPTRRWPRCRQSCRMCISAPACRSQEDRSPRTTWFLTIRETAPCGPFPTSPPQPAKAGTIEILATWFIPSDNPAVLYTVYDGNDTNGINIGTVYVNQTASPCPRPSLPIIMASGSVSACSGLPAIHSPLSLILSTAGPTRSMP